MMRSATLVLIALMFMQPTPARGDDEAKRLNDTLQAGLAKLANSSDSTPRIKLDGTNVIVGEHKLQLAFVSEQVVSKGGKFISAARLEVSVDGKNQEQLTEGVVGVGDSAIDASRTVVSEWYAGSGKALLDAAASSDTTLTQSGFKVYPGYMGVRGEPPNGWVNGTDEMHAKILDAIKSSFPANHDDGKFHCIQLMLTVSPDGKMEGECRVDGKVSDEAFSGLKKLPWPTTSKYMFKQTYILK